MFSFIRFSSNPQLQYVFSKVLEEEADDFNLELGIDTSCLLVPELFSQLLQPVISQRPLCYKYFEIGALQQVCSGNYVFCIAPIVYEGTCPQYKSKITDTETIKCDNDIVFPFLNKGELISNVRTNRPFYLRNQENDMFCCFSIEIYRFKTINYMNDNGTLSLDNKIGQSVDIKGVYFKGLFDGKDVNVPVMISVRYVSYISSLQFFVKAVGADTRDEALAAVIETGEPLTLSRF
ncbi:hypothetical protein EDC94DRAFT_235550 [Helicostylum pulchrum]|nr:hypothetical protein EDC94DRAFT_235550 [Helicostylum pulchrum]